MASVRFSIGSGLSPVPKPSRMLANPTPASTNPAETRTAAARASGHGSLHDRLLPARRFLGCGVSSPGAQQIAPLLAASEAAPPPPPPSTPRSRGDCLLVRRSHDCEGERPSAGPTAMGVGDADAVEATTPCGHDEHPRGARRSRTAILAACRSSHVTVDPSSSAPHGAAGGAGRPRAESLVPRTRRGAARYGLPVACGCCSRLTRPATERSKCRSDSRWSTDSKHRRKLA